MKQFKYVASQDIEAHLCIGWVVASQPWRCSDTVAVLMVWLCGCEVPKCV